MHLTMHHYGNISTQYFFWYTPHLIDSILLNCLTSKLFNRGESRFFRHWRSPPFLGLMRATQITSLGRDMKFPSRGIPSNAADFSLPKRWEFGGKIARYLDLLEENARPVILGSFLFWMVDLSSLSPCFAAHQFLISVTVRDCPHVSP